MRGIRGSIHQYFSSIDFPGVSPGVVPGFVSFPVIGGLSRGVFLGVLPWLIDGIFQLAKGLAILNPSSGLPCCARYQISPSIRAVSSKARRNAQNGLSLSTV